MQLLNVLGESKTSGLSVWDIFFFIYANALLLFFHYRHALYLLIYKMVK